MNIKIDNSLINLMASRSGIAPHYIEYDYSLTNALELLSGIIIQNSLDLRIYGGTAINRGYLKDKQRLSVDIDLETSESVSQSIKKLSSALSRANADFEVNYNTILLKNLNVRIEIMKNLFQANKIKLELHSLMEYFGFPIKSVVFPSYDLDYLLARKLYALSRRMIYKDIYDAYFSINTPTKKLFTYIEKISKIENWDIINTIKYNIEKGHYEKKSEEYKLRTQLRYRMEEKLMLNEIAYKLTSFKKNKLKSKKKISKNH